MRRPPTVLTPRVLCALPTAACPQPVHNAAHGGSLATLKLLHTPPAPAMPAALDALTHDGCTPLHLAAIGGHLDAVKWLLDKGAAVDAVTADGLTAATLADLSSHQHVYAYLLSQGAPAPPPPPPPEPSEPAAAAAARDALLPQSAMRHVVRPPRRFAPIRSLMAC